MKDPHGKGPALILHAKRNFDSLEFGESEYYQEQQRKEQGRRKTFVVVRRLSWMEDNFNGECSYLLPSAVAPSVAV